MSVLARYKTWRVMHLLNRIPYLLSKEQFEQSDRILQEASRVYSALPEDIKKQKLQVEDLFIEMRKLLGSEFRRKLDRQLSEERISRIPAPTISKRMHVEYGKNIAKSYLAEKRKQIKKEAVKRSLDKIKSTIVTAPAVQDKIKQWKKQGYDTTLVEKKSRQEKKAKVARQKTAKPKKPEIKQDFMPDSRIKDLQDRISAWKKQGYDTAMLEKQLKTLAK